MLEVPQKRFAQILGAQDANSVDEQNPALVGMDEALRTPGKATYLLVQEFAHPLYERR